MFDLTKTYFLIAGIAGINSKFGTLGSVALARYAVQVDLQYEFDARDTIQLDHGLCPSRSLFSQ